MSPKRMPLRHEAEEAQCGFLGVCIRRRGSLTRCARGVRSGVRGRGQEEWVFAIAGWDQGGHEAELKCLCDELGLAWADASNVEGIRDQVAGVRWQQIGDFKQRWQCNQ